MATYTPISFAPIVYPDWGDLFDGLPDEQCAQLLKAIARYPEYEPPQGNIAWKFIKGQLDKQYQKFLERTQKAKASRQCGATNVDERRLTSTNEDERQQKMTEVDHKPIPKPIPQPKLKLESESKSVCPQAKQKTTASAMTHRFALTAIPEEWASYCKQVRPDLDPAREFQDFKFYFTEGKGSSKIRSDKGWNQSWQGWIRRAKETPRAESSNRDDWKVKPENNWREEQEAKERANGLDHQKAIMAFLRSEKCQSA